MISEYSPVRHLATIAFPYSVTIRYMFALTAYFDETGSGSDLNSKFCGMGGVVSTPELWGYFEEDWRERLDQDGLSHFHMSEFANYQGEFREGWKSNESRRRDLLSDLWNIVERIETLITGSIVPMELYREIMENKLRIQIRDVYFLSYADCLVFISVLVASFRKHAIKPDWIIATVFDDKKGIKGVAHELHESLMSHLDIKDRMPPPVFRDMKQFLPLQAADMVAYELYKECERQFNKRGDTPRYGFQRIEAIMKRKWDSHKWH